jgi:hypothetical protein
MSFSGSACQIVDAKQKLIAMGDKVGTSLQDSEFTWQRKTRQFGNLGEQGSLPMKI